MSLNNKEAEASGKDLIHIRRNTDETEAGQENEINLFLFVIAAGWWGVFWTRCGFPVHNQQEQLHHILLTSVGSVMCRTCSLSYTVFLFILKVFRDQ